VNEIPMQTSESPVYGSGESHLRRLPREAVWSLRSDRDCGEDELFSDASLPRQNDSRGIQTGGNTLEAAEEIIDDPFLIFASSITIITIVCPSDMPFTG
jgi:hypothetical protein